MGRDVKYLNRFFSQISSSAEPCSQASESEVIKILRNATAEDIKCLRGHKCNSSNYSTDPEENYNLLGLAIIIDSTRKQHGPEKSTQYFKIYPIPPSIRSDVSGPAHFQNSYSPRSLPRLFDN